jgi:hypothetical protein
VFVEIAEQVVERPVLEHQDHEMVEPVEAGKDGRHVVLRDGKARKLDGRTVGRSDRLTILSPPPEE